MDSVQEDLPELVEKLFHRVSHGIKPGLENTLRLFDLLDIPLDDLPVIHIAGTNGKGSTAAMLESVLGSAGYSTGLFTSPHLVDFNERYRIQGQSVDDDALLPCLRKLMAVLEEDDLKNPEAPITFFECSTAIAMMLFLHQKVDVAIMETGLGGRLDATNVLFPVLSVITRIDCDHMQWLGETLPQIAYEKAGIIKPNVPVVLSAQQDQARSVLLAKAKAVDAPVYETENVQILELKKGFQPHLQIATPNDDYGKIIFPLSGRFQYENLSTAVTALEVLQKCGWEKIDRKAVKQGLQKTRWPGRIERVSEAPPVILDCAHNPSGMNAFLETIRANKPKGMPLGFIFGCSDDKDMATMLKSISQKVDRIWLVEFNSPRSASFPRLEKEWENLNAGLPMSKGRLETAKTEAFNWAEKEGAMVAVGGSIFLIADWKRLYP